MTLSELARAASLKKADIQNLIRAGALKPSFDAAGHYTFTEDDVKTARREQQPSLTKTSRILHLLAWVGDVFDNQEIGRDLHKNRPTHKKHKWTFDDKYHFRYKEEKGKRDASTRR